MRLYIAYINIIYNPEGKFDMIPFRANTLALYNA